MHKTRSEIKKIIERYKHVLSGLGVDAQSVILYGSFANGKPRKDSDIDLVIVSKDFGNMKQPASLLEEILATGVNV